MNVIIPNADGSFTISRSHTIYWTKDGSSEGVFHREDGPALIYKDGTMVWLRNGSWHREDGPCVVNPEKGYKIWALNNINHRLDGPAIEYTDSNKNDEWYVNGEDITEQVVPWLKENDFPHHSQWTEEHKLMFKLRWE